MGLFDLIKDVVKTPIAIAADVVTLGGALNERDEPYTKTNVNKILQDIEDILED